MSDTSLHLHWFRQDLRLTDNPALYHAAELGHVMAVYIVDDDCPYATGEASQWWLMQSLIQLSEQIAQRGGSLYLFRGNPVEIINDLVNQLPIQSVHWNRRYEAWQIKQDSLIKQHLSESGIAVHSGNASLLFEPWEIVKTDGSAYKVFTPYYNKVLQGTDVLKLPLPASTISYYSLPHRNTYSVSLEQIIVPVRWHDKLAQYCQPGELAAKDALSEFINFRLAYYLEQREYPARENTSRLSANLHFGEISPRQIYFAITHSMHQQNGTAYLRQLIWREFSYYQMFYNPTMDTQPLRQSFNAFPWCMNNEYLASWQQGKTGIPIIDAGMRELWQTGAIHNRVRMLVASFLVKNLGIHWHAGMAWFQDCLVDADLANNSCGWQWVAGCGIDSAPFFRIFNPVTQSRKYDPDGHYIKKFCPELTALSTKYIHAPWLAPEAYLAEINLIIGRDYPLPVVDLKQSRDSALSAYRTLST